VLRGRDEGRWLWGVWMCSCWLSGVQGIMEFHVWQESGLFVNERLCLKV